MKKFFQKCKGVVVAAVVAIGSAVVSLVTPTVSYAEDLDVAALFTAIDLTGIKANILTMLLVGIGVTMLFVGYRLYKRGANKVG